MILYFGGVSISFKELLINGAIKDKEVRVIDDDGSQLGIMNIRDAIKHASDKELDLVNVAPTAKPPACRVMDYGKFRFEQIKKEKEARKNQHIVEIKEVRMSANIDTNDFNTKSKSALKFLKEGNKVKASVRFRGRELAYTSKGEELLLKLFGLCEEFGSIEKPPKMEGRSMVIFMSPKITK